MIAAAARTIAAKLREATPRERAGLSLLAALLACTAAVYAMDWAANTASEASVSAQRASDSAATVSALQDAGYRQQVETDSAKVWRWSRVGDELSGEEVVVELELMSAQAGFVDPVVALIEPAQSRGRVGGIDVSIAAPFDWGSFLALLDAIAQADLSIAVRSIDVIDDTVGQRMTLVVTIPVIEPEAAT